MRRAWLLAGLLLLGALLVLAPGGPQVGVDTPTDRVTLTFVDGTGGDLGTVRARVADGPIERHRGLSDTDHLAPDGGMVFVYPAAGDRTFVMRGMTIPLDIIFVGADRRVNTIYHAAAEDDRHFEGQAQWVIEVNRGYARAHGLTVGDQVRGLPD